MEQLPEKIQEIKGVKNVRRNGAGLKIELFTDKVRGADAEKIKGDLRKISQKLRSELEDARQKGEIKAWEWNIKPQKRYQDAGIGGVTDRKEKGHNPAHYNITIE